jgi:hypothetical protein
MNKQGTAIRESVATRNALLTWRVTGNPETMNMT